MSTIGKLAALSALLVVAVLAVGAAYTGSADSFAVTNESVTVDYSTSTQVDAVTDAVSFESAVTVRNTSDVELANGTDYVWHPGNGSVSWIDTAQTSNGEAASISYNYTAPDSRSRALAAVLELPFKSLGFLLLLLGGLALLSFFSGLPGGGGR